VPHAEVVTGCCRLNKHTPSPLPTSANHRQAHDPPPRVSPPALGAPDVVTAATSTMVATMAKEERRKEEEEEPPSPTPRRVHGWPTPPQPQRAGPTKPHAARTRVHPATPPPPPSARKTPALGAPGRHSRLRAHPRAWGTPLRMPPANLVPFPAPWPGAAAAAEGIGQCLPRFGLPQHPQIWTSEPAAREHDLVCPCHHRELAAHRCPPGNLRGCVDGLLRRRRGGREGEKGAAAARVCVAASVARVGAAQGQVLLVI
jgi:hypothetical protein